MGIRKISLFLMILILAAAASAADTDYVFVVDDQGPAEDVITIVDAMKHFNLNTQTAKLNSEVTKADLKNKVTVFVYYDEAVIFFEDDVSRDDYTFASDLSIYLKQKGIPATFKSVSDVTSDDLEKSLPGQQKPECTDSDGRDPYVRGTNQFNGSSTIEMCVWNDGKPTNGEEGTKVVETWCENGIKKEEVIACQNKCKAGACVKAASQECTDSDGGLNIFQAGEATSPDGSGTVDYCSFLGDEKGVLKEAICENNAAIHVEKECPAEQPYCNRGVCSSQKPVCTDTDSGDDPENKGTVIEPRFENGPKHTDYCESLSTLQPYEDGCKGSDCGLREYFCTTPYRTTSYRDVACPDGCKDGECVKTASVLSCTDSDNGKDFGVKGTTRGIGEFISDPNYDGGMAERTDYCDADVLVEYFCQDSTRIGYIRKTCEHGCGNGICYGAVRQPIPETVPIIRPEPITEPPQCSGCESDGYCIPMGSRMVSKGEPVYCDFDEQLKEQKKLGSACQNNFECTSNQCSDGTCISLQEELRETKGMLQKILGWLGRIFG